MKITQGALEHITQLAISRQAGELSSAEYVELFDSIDCLDYDELSELYKIVGIGAERYGADIPDISVKEKSAVEQLFSVEKLGAYLIAGADVLFGRESTGP